MAKIEKTSNLANSNNLVLFQHTYRHIPYTYSGLPAVRNGGRQNICFPTSPIGKNSEWQYVLAKTYDSFVPGLVTSPTDLANLMDSTLQTSHKFNGNRQVHHESVNLPLPMTIYFSAVSSEILFIGKSHTDTVQAYRLFTTC